MINSNLLRDLFYVLKLKLKLKLCVIHRCSFEVDGVLKRNLCIDGVRSSDAWSCFLGTSKLCLVLEALQAVDHLALVLLYQCLALSVANCLALELELELEPELVLLG